jgi:glycosyltransferase involved in cell wall biosynthesis
MVRLLTGLPRNTGVGQYVSLLARMLGPSVPTRIEYFGEMSSAQYEQTRMPPPGLGRHAVEYARLRLARKGRASSTHVAWEGFGPVFGRRTRLITVHHVFGRKSPWGPDVSITKRLVLGAARRGYERVAADGILSVVPSPDVKRSFERWYGADPARVILVPHGTDTNLFRPGDRSAARRSLGFGEEEFVVLSIGTDDYRKATDTLLSVWTSFQARNPLARLVKIGPSPMTEDYLRARRDARLTYLRVFPPGRAPEMYSAADVILQPSRLEGFCATVYESMACGVPTVTSDIPVFREGLGEMWRGAPVGDVQGFVELLEERSSQGPAGADPRLREYVLRHYPLERFAERYRSLYSEAGLLDESHGR